MRFTLPWLTLIAPLLAVRLGMRADLGALMLSLGVHEAAHLCAAWLLKVNISEIRLMPFGGSARMENPYHLPPLRLMAVAAAGPAANFLMMMLVSSAANWKLIHFETARSLLEPNLVLFLFNLLPALPLDGGRIMTAVAAHILDENRAVRAGIACGRALAALLIAAMVLGGLRRQVWNLSFLLAAVFILSSERDEKRALGLSKALRIQESLGDFDMRPARLYQLDGRHSAAQALSLLRPKESAWFIVTEGGVARQLLDGRMLVRSIAEGAPSETVLSDFDGLRLCAQHFTR